VFLSIFLYFEVLSISIRKNLTSYNFNEFFPVPLFFASGALAISFLLLYFLPKFYYDVWKKFARVYIPVCLVLFVWLADMGGGFGMSSFTPPDGMAMFFSGLYLVLILLILTLMLMIRFLRKK